VKNVRFLFPPNLLILLILLRWSLRTPGLFAVQSIIDVCPGSVTRNVTVDFEISIHNVKVSIWPSTNFVGCRFHSIQACGIVKFKSWDLEQDIIEKKNQWLRRNTFRLTFLDLQEVLGSYADI